MDRRYVLAAFTGGVAALAATGVVIATAETRGPVFIAGDKPVTEEQVRGKLQATATPTSGSCAKATTSRPPARRTARPPSSGSMRRPAGSPTTTTMTTTERVV